MQRICTEKARGGDNNHNVYIGFKRTLHTQGHHVYERMRTEENTNHQDMAGSYLVCVRVRVRVRARPTCWTCGMWLGL